MNFINKQHQKDYEEIKKGMGFRNDIGEYASFTYILSSPMLSSKKDLILEEDYRFRGIDKVQEKMSLLSNSEQVLINLALSFYGSYGGETVLNTFMSLDKENFEVAINSIRIRFGM